MIIPGATPLALMLLCGALGGCVTGGDRMDRTAAGVDRVASGTPTFMQQTYMQQTYMTMDERCRPVKRPTAVITRDPAHGKVRMTTRRAAAVYGPGAYAHCDGKVGRSLAFEYTSKPGYRGHDAFEVRVRYADGETRDGRFEIAVE